MSFYKKIEWLPKTVIKTNEKVKRKVILKKKKNREK